MTRAVIAGFYFECMGMTRDEVIERMDTFAVEGLNQIGGAPWKLVQDGVERIEARTPLADDEGYCYTGARKYIFVGPLVGLPFQAYHEGFKPQQSVEDAQ
jgi:hypothetical protein